MESPQGASVGGEAQCLPLDVLPPMKKAFDSECEADGFFGKELLGGENRLAVYVINMRHATSTPAANAAATPTPATVHFFEPTATPTPQETKEPATTKEPKPQETQEKPQETRLPTTITTTTKAITSTTTTSTSTTTTTTTLHLYMVRCPSLFSKGLHMMDMDMKVSGLHYSGLAANKNLENTFAKTVEDSIAGSTADEGISHDHVCVGRLSSGSVAVRTLIVLPDGVDTANITKRLASPRMEQRIAESIVAGVRKISGIEAVSTGKIGVSHIVLQEIAKPSASSSSASLGSSASLCSGSSSSSGCEAEGDSSDSILFKIVYYSFLMFICFICLFCIDRPKKPKSAHIESASRVHVGYQPLQQSVLKRDLGDVAVETASSQSADHTISTEGNTMSLEGGHFSSPSRHKLSEQFVWPNKVCDIDADLNSVVRSMLVQRDERIKTQGAVQSRSVLPSRSSPPVRSDRPDLLTGIAAQSRSEPVSRSSPPVRSDRADLLAGPSDSSQYPRIELKTQPEQQEARPQSWAEAVAQAQAEARPQ